MYKIHFVAMSFFLPFFLLFFHSYLFSQDTASIKVMEEIKVKAFESNRRLIDVPAAIGYVSQPQLLRFNNTSVLNAINTVPGVRMEERSPGSYRLSIRGSSLRSPFGIRNVKVYMNEIPFTEPGGTTYLNQLGFYTIQSIEILKGPAGSLYGAGNGGTVLLKTYGSLKPAGLGIDYSIGSFRMHQINGYLQFGNAVNQQTIRYTRLQSNGYRDWTKSRRDIVSWDGHFTFHRNQLLHTFFMLGDLFYQTPGGITSQQFAEDPRQARPAAGALPGSKAANASIAQKTLFAGVSYDCAISSTVKNTTALYAVVSAISNPSIRNYEKRKEPHTGGRTFFTFQPAIKTGILKIIAGMEIQKGWYSIRVSGNKNGVIDTLQTADKVHPFIWSSFVQADWMLPHHWFFTAGASLTKNRIAITRITNPVVFTQKSNYDNEVSPRLALLKKITEDISMYASVAKGFSPPTAAEVLPSTGIIAVNLNAEEGWNYETGIKATLLKSKLLVNVSTYLYNLHNAIVQRRDAGGADYFINAGAAKQWGLEGFIKYNLLNKERQFINQCTAWISYTLSDFKYSDFKQLATVYSGKQLPGIPRNSFVAGVDIFLKTGTYLNMTYTYNDASPLNDANTVYANRYHLLNIKAGVTNILFGKIKIDLFAGADNIFNNTYSLGNDINAAANRFFNAAPVRNFYAGISVFKRSMKSQSLIGTSL